MYSNRIQRVAGTHNGHDLNLPFTTWIRIVNENASAYQFVAGLTM